MSCAGASQRSRHSEAQHRQAKHTSFEALAMSPNAGGGNLGTIFSILTYSVMMNDGGDVYGWVEDKRMW